ncbi:MAG: MlaD family protein, partial [Flavobacteriales bacterium]
MSREVKIGIIVVISLAVAIFGITYLKGEQLFEEKTVYYSFYKNIDGLNEGNPVVFNGFKIGQVTKIDLDISEEANFKVEFKVTDDRLPIPIDSKAKIISSDLFGSKAIEIILGENPEFVKNGDTLLSEHELGLAEAVKKELLPLKQKTDQMIDGVDEILENLRLVFDDDATKGLPKAFESMERMMLNLERTSGRL